MIAKLLVAYRTRLVEGAEKNLPEFKAPANYTDHAKIVAAQAAQREAFLAGAKDMPYTGTFDQVIILDRKNRKRHVWLHAATEEGKPPVSVRVRNYLLKFFPDSWSDDLVIRKPPTAIFIGFDVRTFLKILGLECSLPNVGKRCPLTMWYANSDHRDLAEAVMPKDYKGFTLPFVLKHRRPVDAEMAKKWDEALLDWPGPGVYPDKDITIMVELAAQLGMLKKDGEE